MVDTKQTYDDLIGIISKVLGEPIDNLNLDTTINIDLGIYGDDWDELMYPILDKYPIEEHSDFDFGRHMRPEGDFILPLLLEMILTIPRLLLGTVIYTINRNIGSRILKKGFLDFQNMKINLCILRIFITLF